MFGLSTIVFGVSTQAVLVNRSNTTDFSKIYIEKCLFDKFSKTKPLMSHKDYLHNVLKLWD